MRLHEFLEDKEFRTAVQGALLKTISLLLKKESPFAILTNIAKVGFEPRLSTDITKKFQPATLFILDGYTLSSAKISDNVLSFEAGFGESNFGSVVSVPIGAILQVFIGENPIFLNMSLESEEPKKEEPKKKEDNSQRSLDALLNNPENKKRLKK